MLARQSGRYLRRPAACPDPLVNPRPPLRLDPITGSGLAVSRRSIVELAAIGDYGPDPGGSPPPMGSGAHGRATGGARLPGSVDPDRSRRRHPCPMGRGPRGRGLGRQQRHHRRAAPPGLARAGTADHRLDRPPPRPRPDDRRPVPRPGSLDRAPGRAPPLRRHRQRRRPAQPPTDLPAPDPSPRPRCQPDRRPGQPDRGRRDRAGRRDHGPGRRGPARPPRPRGRRRCTGGAPRPPGGRHPETRAP